MRPIARYGGTIPIRIDTRFVIVTVENEAFGHGLFMILSDISRKLYEVSGDQEITAMCIELPKRFQQHSESLYG